MAPLAFEFFFRLLWGWNFFVFFISRNESSEDFLRVSFRFSLGFSVLALLSGMNGGVPSSDLALVGALLIGAALYLSRKAVFFRILSLVIYVIVPLYLFKTRSVAFGVNFILSSSVLAGAFVGQFLGHWYLNVPNIHIREFKRVSFLALFAIALRFVWTASVVFLFRPVPDEAGFLFQSDSEFFAIKGTTWLGLGTFGVILFASRVLWGLVAPAILTWMAKKTIDLRATQSATGIFYANSVLVLLGEVTALYLERQLQWPL